jgi:hypothetical protein
MVFHLDCVVLVVVEDDLPDVKRRRPILVQRGARDQNEEEDKEEAYHLVVRW